jgi:GTP-binding protein
MKLAIVGRRNVGKSTFVNTLAGEERVITSELPGTTRDAVDVRFEMDGKSFVAIDTAGLRKLRKLDGTLEFYGYSRAQRSVRRADVVILMIDAASKVAELDKRIGQYIAEQHKPCIIVVNKWDLAGDLHTEAFTKYINANLVVLPYAPISYISANSGRNVRRTIQLALKLFEQAHQRVTTGELNRVLEAALSQRKPPARRNISARIYYATQTSVAPPTLDIFVNDPGLFDRNYTRYLENQLRDALPFSEVPIRLFFHSHDKKAHGKR